MYFSQRINDLFSMKKFLIWLAVSLVALLLLAFVAFQWLRYDTKRHSPAATVEFVSEGNTIIVDYCHPYKKGRTIFGELVPYGEVWRTGANEATTFSTTSDLQINGEILPQGKYTLWTIPGEAEWEIIFNSEMYGWGVGFDQKASRQAQHDVLSATVPVKKLDPPVEQFTIEITQGNDAVMNLRWDDTSVSLPMEFAE